MEAIKNLTKLANLLLDNLKLLEKQRLVNVKDSVEKLSDKCSQITHNSALLKAAINRGWYLSAQKVKSRLSIGITDISYSAAQLKNITADSSRCPAKPSDLVEELRQMDREFCGFKSDFNARSISVISRPVVLDGIELGPFEIKLFIEDIPRLYNESPYRVIALDPNPAAPNPDVTHPHVSCDRLCEGDGYVSITRALQQGRLFDFFSIVENILNTYNPDSPYVPLSEWCGVPCYDCGCNICDEETYYCEGCDRDYCPNCILYCSSCDLAVCHGCVVECPDCGKILCLPCTTECADCSQIYCGSCLSEERICHECIQQRKDNENEEQTQKTLQQRQTHPSVQPDGVVEAAVHAGHNRQ